MTYNEIVKQALTHLEYRTDEDSVAEFFDRFVLYINEAVHIIAEDLKMTQNVSIVSLPDDKRFNISDIEEAFPDVNVTKITDVFDATTGRLYPFVTGDSFGEFVVGAKPGTRVTVRFRYMPKDKTGGDDEPGIPAVFHPILWFYVVHCHHNTRSTSTDYDRTKWLQEFNKQRKIIARSYGAANAYSWKNLPWHTGEI